MNEYSKFFRIYFFPICLIILLSFSRIIPHPYNFTPILAVWIFSGFYFKQFFLGSLIVVFSMFLGDIYFGFHNTMFFTYISLIIAVGLGIIMKHFKIYEILLNGLLSSVCFLIITNFGAWLTLEMYEKNLTGLINSYVLGIPFFHNTLLSTFLYLFLLKAVLELLLKNNKLLKN